MEIYDKFMGAKSRRCMQYINENEVVLGTVVVNCQGFPETTSLDSMSASTYATYMRELAVQTNHAVKEIDASNNVVAIRLESKTSEVMTVPDPEFLLIVVVTKDRHM